MLRDFANEMRTAKIKTGFLAGISFQFRQFVLHEDKCHIVINLSNLSFIGQPTRLEDFCFVIHVISN